MKFEGHFHGIALPLSALRNPESSGIGEFCDLLPMIDWCWDVGFKIIQLLPLNDSGCDSSPYMALSANALNPIYIALRHLPFVESVENYDEIFRKLSVCNSSQRFNYYNIYKNKELFLRIYFRSVFPRIREMEQFREFCELQKEWLDDFARFRALKAQNGEKPWWEWREPEEAPPEDELLFYKMVQFLAFSQFKQVREHARAKGIFLKGDIPILLNRDSSDVWAARDLFFLDVAAGAPPDMYNEEGQFWGFPIYNWKRHEETGFGWWRQRLRVAEQLFDIFRIDHIVGFFRIWAIPPGKKAKEGFFIPENENEWWPQGEKLLRMIQSSTEMFPIGEDLGVIPPKVRQIMLSLGIPGTKIYRWERRWEGDRSYIPPEEYIPESMMSVSTHDSETLGEWWEHGSEEVLAFCRFKGWRYEAPLSFEKRYEILHDSHRAKSRFHINLLSEYLNLFPELSWDDPNDERINVPGTVSASNWTYRFRPRISEIVSHDKLAGCMKRFSRLP
jgi:4-alpha-glucanotransferase